MKNFTPLLSTAIIQAPWYKTLPPVRNWHDKLMSLNAGRGFDMILFMLPTDHFSRVSFEYVNGKNTTPVPAVPDEFGNFSGFVEGIQNEGYFYGITFYNKDGDTDTHTYTEALRRMRAAGFDTLPYFITETNGWNGILQFAEKYHGNTGETPIGFTYDWVVLPDSPRLASSARRNGLAIGAKFSTALSEVAEPSEVTEHKKPVTLLLRGVFDQPQSEITEFIEAEGAVVVKQYVKDVDAIVVPSAETKGKTITKARKDGKEILVIDDLEVYLTNHNK